MLPLARRCWAASDFVHHLTPPDPKAYTYTGTRSRLAAAGNMDNPCTLKTSTGPDKHTHRMTMQDAPHTSYKLYVHTDTSGPAAHCMMLHCAPAAAPLL